MRIHHPGQDLEQAVDIQATAFRDEKTAALVTITSLSFDRCQLSSDAGFRIGERLRLHIPGQGWIIVEVRSRSGGTLHASFVTRCDS